MPLVPNLGELPINLLCIDPGLNNIGIANMVVQYGSGSILSIEAYTVKPEQHINNLNLIWYLDERSMKLVVLRNLIINIMSTRQVDMIICEAPFFYAGKPAAFKALVEVITTLKLAAADTNILVPFLQLEPLMVKRIVKSLNIHEKDSTKDALKVLGLDRYINLDVLDEHSIDAISIGYAFLKSRELLGG